MSGREEALARCFAHEQRRQGRLDRVGEKAWLRSLSDRQLSDYVRRLNQVDRAVAACRKAAA